MRPIKRFLLRASEIAAAFLGIILSVILVVVVGMAFDPEEQTPLAPLTFLLGCVLTIVGLVWFRRRTRPWKIRYDAADWVRSKAERKLHPARAQYKRTARRILIWLPTSIAAFVLFFFPVASHLVPRSQHLGRYRVSIPWTFTILPIPPSNSIYALIGDGNGRFGVTSFAVPFLWQGSERATLIVFQNIPYAYPATEIEELNSKQGVQIREFRLGDVTLTCWQYRNEYYRPYDAWYLPSGPVRVNCGTPRATRQQSFWASFDGYEPDLRAFYQIIERVTTLK